MDLNDAFKVAERTQGFLRGDYKEGLLSTRTLQKIKEWDNAQA